MLIKSADNKDAYLQILEERKKFPLNAQQSEWLERELWAVKRGIKGEKDAAYFIDTHFKDSDTHAVLHDLRIEVNGEIAQIDHLVLSHLFCFIFETKNFNGNLSINEFGEFSVRYASGKEIGIPSPIEQNYRHQEIIAKLLDQIGIKTFLGEKMSIRHAVLVSPNSIISRPDNFDTANVIKADAFRDWHDRFVKQESKLLKLAPTVVKLLITKPHLLIFQPNRNSIIKKAELLLEHHCVSKAELPEFMKHTENGTEITKNESLLCSTCLQPISEAEARFCSKQSKRFAGKIYCREHQKAFSVNDTVPKAEQKICDAVGCNKALSPAIIAYCEEHSDRFGGKCYCMFHQKEYKAV